MVSASPYVLGDMGAVEERIQRNLLAFMKERGLSAPELHFMSGIPIGTLQKYMNGQRIPKIGPLQQLADALGRPAGDFMLEVPPPGKPYKKPAFGLRILDEGVDADLLKRAQLAMDELNVEHAARLAKRESTKPAARTYVTDMEEATPALPASEPELPGRKTRREISAGSAGKSDDGHDGHDDLSRRRPSPREGRPQSQKTKR